MPAPVYLDYAAATPVDPKVLAAMTIELKADYYNPSSTYLAARGARRTLENARQRLATQIGAKPAEVVFTTGATESNNLALQGVMRRWPDGQLLVSAVEHESVLAPAGLFRHKVLPVDNQGRLKLEALTKAINDQTVLVSLMMVNNETGGLQPVKPAAALISRIRTRRLAKGNKRPLYLHSDAAQAAGYYDLQVSRLGVDLMSINGAKLYGPRQVGALFVKAGVELEPLILGGGQEYGLRSGTENTAAAVGLAMALEIAGRQRRAEFQRLTRLKQEFLNMLRNSLPMARINADPKQAAPHIVSICFPGSDNERLMMQLDEAGFQVAVGSACSASSRQASHVLAAMGLPESDIRASLRISFGRATTEGDIKRLVKVLSELLANR